MHQCHSRFKAFRYFIYKFIRFIQVLLYAHLVSMLLPILFPSAPLSVPLLRSFLHIHHLLAIPLPDILLISSILVLSAAPHVASLSHI